MRRRLTALLARAARYAPGDSYWIDCMGLGAVLGVWDLFFRWFTQ